MIARAARVRLISINVPSPQTLGRDIIGKNMLNMTTLKYPVLEGDYAAYELNIGELGLNVCI